MNKLYQIRCFLFLIAFFTYWHTSGQGSMLIVGGGSEGSWSNEPYQWAVEQSATKRVAIIGFSSASEWLPNYFMQLGADYAKNFQVSSQAAANQQTLYDSLMTYDVVFFRGGNQANYYNNYKNTLLFDAVTEIYGNGGVVGGTSAGLAIMSGVVFTAANGSVVSKESLENINNQYNTLSDDMFQFMPGFVFDSHFVERGRLARLMGFILKWYQDEGELLTGIGVDDQMALIIDSTGLATALGTGTVTILRPNAASILQIENNQGNVKNMSLTQLSHGWQYDLQTSTVIPNSTAELITALDTNILGNMDIWLTGSNTVSGNQSFFNDLSEYSGPLHSILIVTSDPAGVAPISNVLNNIAPVYATLNLADINNPNAPVSNEIFWNDIFVFHGSDIAAMPDFFANTPNGQTLLYRMQLGGVMSVFMGDMAAVPGNAMVLNYRTSNASYYGELEIVPGAGLIPHVCVQPNVYESSNFVENTVSGLMEAMVTSKSPFALWLDAGQYARVRPVNSVISNTEMEIYVKGNMPVQVLSFAETYVERVPFFGNYDRNLYGISSLTYEWLNDTSIFIGMVDPVISNPQVFPIADTWKIVSNPANDYLSIQLSGNLKDAHLTIYDMQGKIIRFIRIHGNEQIYIGDLPAGSYLLYGEGKTSVFQKF